MTAAELQQAASQIAWYHTMFLGRGVHTRGIYDPSRTLGRLGLPRRLDGQRVLDVGAWDGFFFRGGFATDHFCWDGEGWGSKDGFLLARKALASQVKDLDVDPLQIRPETVGSGYDIVLLLGVLYHLRDPMIVLDRLHSVTGGVLVVETEVGMLLTRRPAAAFYPDKELNDDPTNWWAPNIRAMAGMLRAAGFREVNVVWKRPIMTRAAKWAYHLARPPRLSLTRALASDRFVFHARI